MINVPIVELWNDLKKLQGYRLPLRGEEGWFKIHVDPFEAVLITQESRVVRGKSDVSRSTDYLTAAVLEAACVSGQEFASVEEMSRQLRAHTGVTDTQTVFLWSLYQAVADLRK